MLFCDIKPFVRFARLLELTKKSYFEEVFPLDARLFFVQSGQGKMLVNSKIYEIKKNDVLIINSGVAYQLLTPEDNISFIAINFDYNQLKCNVAIPIQPVQKNLFDKLKKILCIYIHIS